MKGECCSYQMAEFGHGDRKKMKSKTREDGIYHTAQIGLGDREERRAKNGLDLISI